jgi:hypothetical protein
MMQKRRGVLAAVGLAFALLIPTTAQSIEVGLEVTPGRLEISVPSGATYNIPLSVRNSSFDTVHVQATMTDFGLGTNGAYQFSRVGTRSNSLLKWAAIRPREFDLSPGNVQQVQLTVQLPQSAALSGEYAGIVFFQTRPQRRRGMAVAFSLRVASKIYETIPGTVKVDGAITKMSSASATRGQMYRVLFHNSGNAHAYLRGQLVVQKGGAVVDQISLASGELVERDSDRLLEVYGKHLEPGSYQAIATIDYGGKTETGGEIAFDVH